MTLNMLVALSGFSITLTAADLVLRPMLNGPVYRRFWPPMPQLMRFNASAASRAPFFGDLARMSGRTDYRQTRIVEFRTDALGFRNAEDARQGVIDLLALGDSYGVGVGTTQDSTWPSLLARRTGLRLYNLSHTGSPWHEFVTLRVTLPLLRIRSHATLVWMLFSGNDLDERYGPLDRAHLDHPGLVGRIRVAFNTFGFRSPVHRLLEDVKRRVKSQSRGGGQWLVSDFLNDRKLLFFQHYVNVRHRSLDQVLGHPHFPNLRATVTAMAKLADSAGLAVRVIVAPSKEEVYSWVLDRSAPWSTRDTTSAFVSAVCRLAGELNMACLDLGPLFCRESKRVFDASRDILWWYDDTHWNDRGNALAAAAIADGLPDVRAGP